MTSTPARTADRVAGAFGPPLRALSATPALIILLLCALALRLTIAYVLFPDSGFGGDVATYTSWAMTMAQHGPGGFYANAGFIDYPPAYLYVLWPIGLLAQSFGGNDPYGLAQGLIKLPPMLIDIGVGFVLYRLVLGWSWPGRRAESLALLAAGLFVFNPVTFYDSALWGQTDTAGSLVVLLGVAALIRGNSEGAAALGVLAALVKPQFGVVLIPLVAVVLLMRHLLRTGSGPRHAPWGPAMLQGWLSREQGFVRLVTSAVVALVVFHVLALPFGIDIPGYLDLMTRTAGTYSWLSVNAYNPWALIGADGQTSLAAGGRWSPDTVALLGPIPGVAIGAVLLVVAFAYGIVRVAVKDDRRTIILTAAFLCMAFFILPTRVHERYLFPVFVFLPILAVAERRWLIALATIAVGSLINLHGILTIHGYGTPNIESLPLGEAFRSQPYVLLSVALQTGVFLVALWALRPRAATVPDGLTIAAQQVAGPVRLGPIPLGIRSVGTDAADSRFGWGAPPTEAAAGGRGPGSGSAEAPLDQPGPADAWVRGPSAREWLLAKLLVPSLRRDRSAELTGERPGRLDRRDLLLVVLVAVAAVMLRGYRLGEPYGMYFDEVYHARTAMEFLQDWRYGEPHSIYEYTHPHLAKYAMALGIEAIGGNRVTATGDLEVAVQGAAIEPRWSPDESPGERDGDRLYVASGGALGVYDLADRGLIATIPVSAAAVAVDADGHWVYVAGSDGTVSRLDTAQLDARRRDAAAELPIPEAFVTLDGEGAPVGLAIVDSSLVVLRDDATLTAIDLDTGDQTGAASVPGAAAMIRLPPASELVAEPAAITDPAAAAAVIADDLGDDADRIEALLRSDAPSVVLAGWPDATSRSAIQGHIDDGTLTGLSFETGNALGVAAEDGLEILDSASLSPLDTIELDAPAYGVALVERGLDDQTAYVSTDGAVRTVRIDSADGPSLRLTIPIPGTARAVLWNEPANEIHVVGTTKDGQPTVYAIDPHGNSLFEDAPLGFDPLVAVVDTQVDRPSEDRTQLLALASDGRIASVDIGSTAFGWRLPGVLMGALTAVCLYLLARLLFRRRSVAVLTAALVLAEGMLFANARIGMNDAYVTGFVVAAATLFAPIWLGIWRRPWVVAPMLVTIGLLLGLALASKWVAAYAIGGLLLLVLLRSALGRAIALLGMVGLTTALGAIAIRAADVPAPHRNWLFLLSMLALTAALAVAVVRRPVRLSREELRFLVVAPIVVGALLVIARFAFESQLPTDGAITGSRVLLVGVVGVVLGAGCGAAAWVAGRRGMGPLAARRAIGPEEPVPADPPMGWLRPGAWGGLPWLFALACLTLIPVAVYVVSYAPWVALGNQWYAGSPPGHSGQTLMDLTLSMYDYHNNLRASHAASSPWWAWPLNLKPVWFYQESFANNTTGDIYDSGNLVVFWLGIPAMIYASIAAWRRRSLPLTLIVLLFAAMWLPWARIDRATFQYHVYSSLPFVVLALGYLLAELWHGPSRLAWAMARVGGALAILGAPLLWLVRQPLCAAAGVSAANPNGVACGAITRTTMVSEQAFAAVVVLIVGGGVAVLGLWWSARGRRADGSGAGSGVFPGGPIGGLLLTVALTLVGVLACLFALSSSPAFKLVVSADELAIGAFLLLAAPAALCLRARDSRRFVVGVVGAAALFFIVWYPNLTGLPMPSSIANVYLGLLPTWNYDFQFAVNLDPPTKGSILDAGTLIIGLVTLIVVVAVMLAARAWRSSRPTGPTELPDLV